MTDIEKYDSESPPQTSLEIASLCAPLAMTDIEKYDSESPPQTSLETASVSAPAPPSPTEGGIAGCLTVLGAFLAMFASFGQTNAFGSYQLWYSTNQLADYSPSDISWIGTMQLWVFFFTGGIIGRMFDAYGPTRLIVAGNIVLSVSLMMTSIATKYYQFILAQGILFGVGFGLLFYPSASATATHFTKYRGTALGIVMSGSSIGGVVFPIMLQRLFNQVGFGWAVRISAFICFGCGTFSCFAVSSRLPKRTPSPWIDRASLKEVNFILFVAAGTICCLGVFVPLIYIVPYGQANSISQALSYDLLSVINAGGTFGRILPAFLADIGGRFNCLIPCTLIAGIFCSAWWSQAHDLPSIMIYAAMYGFFIGPWFSLQISCLAQFSKMENIGARVGMLYSGAAFFALVGAPIAGALLTTQKGNYTGLIEWAGASLICSSLIYLVVKLRLNKSVLAKV